MKSKLIHDGDEKTYALIFETGDEALSELRKFAQEYRLGASRLSGIGAFSRARLGFFDWKTKDYRPIYLDEQVEVLSFVGDIVLETMNPKSMSILSSAKRTEVLGAGILWKAMFGPVWK
jgi:predicted DNA-binding protein with PD1-like motif